MQDMRSPSQRVHDYFAPRWNSLIPKRATNIQIIEGVGVRFLHATKGWRQVSYKRFLVRGIN